MSVSCLSLLSSPVQLSIKGSGPTTVVLVGEKKWGYPISTVTDCEQGAPSELKHGEMDKRREKTSKEV